jgi:hypothetical protein
VHLRLHFVSAVGGKIQRKPQRWTCGVSSCGCVCLGRYRRGRALRLSST